MKKQSITFSADDTTTRVYEMAETSGGVVCVGVGEGKEEETRRCCKLRVHKPDQKYGHAQIALNPKEWSGLKEGDLLVIEQEVEGGGGGGSGGGQKQRRVIVQWSTSSASDVECLPPQNTVSLEAGIANQFNFRNFADVSVCRISPEKASVDIVELTLKEQYLSRSDMWRVRKEMVGKVLHTSLPLVAQRIRTTVKKKSFVTSTVNELWRQGERVSFGFVEDATRVVFRSSSSKMFIFIQMSREMWELDSQGDLYFEKCINGLLPKMFKGWKEANCSHYVSVIIYSRWYYDADALVLGNDLYQKLHRDYRNRYYQDFYRLLVQNEHYEDWLPVLLKLKRAFHNYHDNIKSFHTNVLKLDLNSVKVSNSCAADGNFLESLNMAFNVFSVHNIDRTLDRTGQQIVSVTPGCGVFNVDRNLSNLTKQRSIDLGVSIDLCCLGEQPLHAVPLFVFHNRNRIDLMMGHGGADIEDYFIPHWMNYNYYNPKVYSRPSVWFKPRIKMPESVVKLPSKISMDSCPWNNPNDPYAYPDFEEHDRASSVLFLESCKENRAQGGGWNHGSVHHGGLHGAGGSMIGKLLKRQNSDTAVDCVTSMTSEVGLTTDGGGTASDMDQHHHQPHQPTNKATVTIRGADCDSIVEKVGDMVKELRVGSADMPSQFERGRESNSWQHGNGVGSSTSHHPHHYGAGDVGGTGGVGVGQTSMLTTPSRQRRKKKPLINPFVPSEFSVRITSNRRRWIHVFPMDPNGRAKQAHHYVSGTSVIYANVEEKERTMSQTEGGGGGGSRASSVIGGRTSPRILTSPSKPLYGITGPHHSAEDIPAGPGAGPVIGAAAKGKTLVWAWGPTGEEQWNPDLEIGVDWKSLIIPALLPTTTDFFPDGRSLANDFVVHDYNLEVGDESIREHWGTKKSPDEYRIEIFEELVSQRLQKGFQIIILPSSMLHASIAEVIRHADHRNVSKECYLSINRIYHRIYMVGPEIHVLLFQYRHKFNLRAFDYQYQFQVPDSHRYEFSTTGFKAEALDKSNWSVIDNYVVTQGKEEYYRLQEGMKYWNSRFILLPNGHPATKVIADQLSDEAAVCDLYKDMDAPDVDKYKLFDGFIRFMEGLNRIRRPGSTKRWLVHNNSPAGTPLSEKLLTVEMPSIIMENVMGDREEGGLHFLPDDNSGVPYTFISAELCHWLIAFVQDVMSIGSAINFGQSLLDSGKIRKLTDDSKSSRFVYGAVFYYIVTDASLPTQTFPTGRWFEAEFKIFPARQDDGGGWNIVNVDLASLTRKPDGGQEEWAQVKHSSVFSATHAFELNLEWLVGIGSTIAELVFSLWCRRAPSCHFHLIPVPLDPFALPHNAKSDPLRCPVQITMDSDVLMEAHNMNLARHLESEVLRRFGFIQLTQLRTKREFVHLSGGMFVLISEKYGFRWSWNPLLSHRYRSLASQSSGDEAFQDKMIADFRKCCNNEHGRLRKILNSLKTRLETSDASEKGDIDSS